MKAVVARSFGGPEVLQLAEVAKPVAAEGQVLVKVAARSVNTVDTMIRRMGPELPLSPEAPCILGMDFSGTIEEVGPGVDYKVGDEVYGCAGGMLALPGSLAEFMTADAKLIAKKPTTLSMKEAAALPLVGITAYEGLERAGLRGDGDGKNVLVHGGSGGVGHVAVQLAKYWGANVFATGGGQPQCDLISDVLKATPINYKSETVADYVKKYTPDAGFDVVYDSVGGPNLAKSIEAAKLNGHIATTNALCEVDLTAAHFKGLSLHIVMMLIPMMYGGEYKDYHAHVLKDLATIADAGYLKPIVDDVPFTLDDAPAAHAHLESGKAVGKIVIVN